MDNRKPDERFAGYNSVTECQSSVTFSSRWIMSFEFTQPKTNWNAGTGVTPYNGDRFTYVDFNRIKNNILYLYNLATQIYPINAQIAAFIENSEDYREGGGDPSIYHYFYLYDGEEDRGLTDFVYADEVNYFEERLDFLKQTCGVTTQGTMQTHNDNGVFIHANQLNYLEKLTADLENYIYPVFLARRRFPIRLSQKNNHIDL